MALSALPAWPRRPASPPFFARLKHATHYLHAVLVSMHLDEGVADRESLTVAPSALGDVLMIGLDLFKLIQLSYIIQVPHIRHFHHVEDEPLLERVATSPIYNTLHRGLVIIPSNR
jgi:hypothetical protein